MDLTNVGLVVLALFVLWVAGRLRQGQLERLASRRRDPSLTTKPNRPEPQRPPAPARPPQNPPATIPAIAVIEAAMSAPPASSSAATRDLATAQVAMLHRCPGCGRPVVGANARDDDQGRRWHLDCRAAG